MEALRGFFAFARAFGERLVRWSLFDRPAEPEQEAEPVGGDFDSGSEDPPSPRLPAPSAPPAEPVGGDVDSGSEDPPSPRLSAP